MDLDTILLECEDQMEKSVEHLSKELRGMRTGRATTAMLEYIKVDYYGSMTDLRELAAISVPEPTQLLVKPFDPGAKSEIVKAIEKSGLGLNPQTEGTQIRIIVPSPSSDRRKQLATQAKKLAEDTKVAVRNARRDANKRIDTLLADKKSGLTEDAAERAQKDVDEATKKQTTRVEEVVTKKVTEIEEA
ncbi:MAG: ribosome recycling factor [Phycisphaerales bacterium]|jgi:ribosome recycling factor